MAEGFTVTGFESETIGTKTITVTYEGFTATFTVEVKEHEPVYAEIITQPVSVIVNGGEVASTTVVAIGDGLTYQWFYRDTTTPEAVGFMPAVTPFAETYSATMNAARDGRQIYCVITDMYGNTVTTDIVTLSIENSLAIVSQPESVAVAMGEQAVVQVEASGENLTYKWYYKDKGASAFQLTGSFTGNTYNVAMTAARNGRELYCVISDAFGHTVETNHVVISIAVDNALQIVTQPQSVSAPEGQFAEVTFEAVGDDLTYKWYYKDANAASFSYTGTFNGPAYKAIMNNVRNGRQLYCVVTDKYGNTVITDTVTISVDVDVELALTGDLTDITVANGESFTATVEAVGVGLTYKWYYKNAGSANFVLTGTFTGNTYTTTMTAGRAGRQIYCVVTDAYGNTVTTSVITLAMAE